LARYLFEHFLKDPAQYDACERYWQDLIRETAISLGQADDWQPWIQRSFMNGTPMERDGNPVSDGKSLKLDRAFRIIQHAPQGERATLTFWLNHEEEYEELPRDELVILLSLSEETGQVAKELLHHWMMPAMTIDRFRAFAAETITDDGESQVTLILLTGGVVALPTDTVYGLCARANNDAAVERIYAVKRRDPAQPMPIFAADLAQAETVGVIEGDARTLAEAFWPGALTIVVPVRPGYRSRALAGSDTVAASVALRVPGDDRLRRLCADVGPLTGTSANIAGREECHTAAEVRAQLAEGPDLDRVDLILDAPVAASGQPSTIVDCTHDPPTIVRPGAIPEEAIRAVLGDQ